VRTLRNILLGSLGCSWLGCLLLFSQMPSRAATINVVNEFSILNNPNGAWSAGWTGALGGTLNLFTLNGSTAPELEVWERGPLPYPAAASTPFIGHNTTAGTIPFTIFHVPTDDLQLHPGIDGVDAVVRWTAPFSGAFFITGKFEGLDSTTTDVHILLNGGRLLSGSIGSNGAAVPFTLTTGVNAGDHLDFVGFGPNYFFDSTGLAATIARGPEPNSFALVIVGLLVFVILRRRRP
jgi:hypothetical protein